jgi:SAM-dependent methyltransferase
MCAELQRKAQEGGYSGSLEVVTSDIDAYIAGETRVFDVVGFCSVLHHLPDYIGTLTRVARLVAPNGFIYTAVDPIHGLRGNALRTAFYHLDGLLFRILRRMEKHGPSEPMADRATQQTLKGLAYYSEYHEVRGGIDDRLIAAALGPLGFDLKVEYHGLRKTRFMQALGTFLRIHTNVKIIAYKRA